MGCSSSKQPAATPPNSNTDAAPGDVQQLGGSKIHFSRLMKDAAARDVLTEYARSERSEENLLFYNEVAAFRKRFTTYGDAEPDQQELRDAAVSIVDRFLREDAPDALNLPSKALAPYKTGLADDHGCNPMMFNPLVRIIYKAIESDTFERFTETEAAGRLSRYIPSVTYEHGQSSQQTSDSAVDEPTTATAAVYTDERQV